MSKDRRPRRRERRAWERAVILDAKNNLLAYDELSAPLQKVVGSIAMALVRFGCVDEDRALTIATQQFCWTARIAGVWESMYAASRAERCGSS